MARNAKVTVIIDDNGSMRLTEKSAKKLGTQLDRVGNSARNTDRGLRGTAQMSSNATKNFAKQSQMMGGVLVPMYATLAAQIFAVTAAFRFFKSAADLRVLEDGQRQYAASTGKNLRGITRALQDATEGQLAFEEAAQATAIGVAAGLTAAQLGRLAKVAKQASTALGRDLTDSFNRLIRGAIKAEPELLDELGIIIRLAEASDKYARSINKTAQELTTFEKSQAVVNAVIEQGEDKFGRFNIEVNKVSQAGKQFNDMLLDIKRTLVPFIELISKVITQAPAFAAAMAGFAFAAPIRSLLPLAGGFNDSMNTRETIGRNLAGAGYVGQNQSAFMDGTYTDKQLAGVKPSNFGESKNPGQGMGYVRQARGLAKIEAGRAEGMFKGFFKRTAGRFELLKGTGIGTMNSIRAAGVLMATGIGAALSTALSVVAWVGILYMIGSIVVEIFKTNTELDKFNSRIDKANDGMKEQLESAKAMRKEMERLADTMTSSQIGRGISNVLNTSTFGDFTGLMNNFDTQEYENNLRKQAAIKAKYGRQSEKGVNYSTEQAATTAAFGNVGAGGMGPIDTIKYLFGGRKKLTQAKEVLKLSDIQKTALISTRHQILGNILVMRKSGIQTDAYTKSIEEQVAVEELLKAAIDTKVPTQEQARAVQEILNGLHKEGAASIGEHTKAISELEGKMLSGLAAARQFGKSVQDSAQAINKGDTFKDRRQQIKNVIDAIEQERTLSGAFGNTGRLSAKEMLGKSTVDSLVKQRGGADSKATIVRRGNPSIAAQVDQANEALRLLGILEQGYKDYYDKQVENELKLMGLKNESDALFRKNTPNKIRKIEIKTLEDVLDIQSKIDEKKMSMSSLQDPADAPTLKKLKDTVKLLEESIPLREALGKFLVEELNIRTELTALEHSNKLDNIKQKVMENSLDQQAIGFGVEQAALNVRSATLAQTQNDLEILRLMNLDVKGKKEIDALEVARANVALLFSEIDIQTKLLEIAEMQLQTRKREADIKKASLLLDLQQASSSGAIGQAADDKNAAISAARKNAEAAELQRKAAAGVDSQGKDLTKTEIDNLNTEANIKIIDGERIVKMASAGYKAAVMMQTSIESAFEKGLTSIFDGGSVKDTFLNFIYDVSKALQSAMITAMTNAFMQASGLNQIAEGGGKLLGGLVSAALGTFFPGMGTAGTAGTEAGFAGGQVVVPPPSSFASVGPSFGANGVYGTARYGGVMLPPFSSGGIAKGRNSGYPVTLHGTEAVVPLPDGKKIPVKMEGGQGNINNVAVSVSIDSSGKAETSIQGPTSEEQGKQFGEVLARAIQNEMIVQAREGGLLSRR